jgi:hypothetical protein
LQENDARASGYPQQSLSDLFKGSTDQSLTPDPSGAGYPLQPLISSSSAQQANMPHPPPAFRPALRSAAKSDRLHAASTAPGAAARCRARRHARAGTGKRRAVLRRVSAAIAQRFVQEPRAVSFRLADDAVQDELVSAPNSLLTGKNTGKFAEFTHCCNFRARSQCNFSHLCNDSLRNGTGNFKAGCREDWSKSRQISVPRMKGEQRLLLRSKADTVICWCQILPTIQWAGLGYMTPGPESSAKST